MFTLERAQATDKVGLVSLVGLVVVPLLVAAGFLWATWDSDTRLDRVPAAIVNADQPVTIDGRLVPLGRQLAGGLVNARDGGGNFNWLLTDAEDARAGLAAGSYAAVVTIPADFSRRATSFSRSDPAEIEPATLDVQTSQIRGIADGVVAQYISLAATNALNGELTRQYLDGIYLGFNRTGEQFATVAAAADRLADGGARLADGLGQTAGGADQLADGTRELSIGLGTLADGTRDLPDQTRRLADGAQRSADGAAELARGMTQFAGGVGRLDDQVPGLTSGIGRLAGGAERLAGGNRQFADGMSSYAGGSRQFATGLQQYADTLAGFEQAVQAPDRLPEQLRCPVPDPQACQLWYAGLVAGTQVGYQGLQDQGDTPGLLTGADTLADRAGQLAAGAGDLAGGAGELSAGLTRLDGGADRLADGIGALAANADRLAGGTSSLATGLGDLADGTDQLAQGLCPLAAGIASAAQGSEQLATGADGLASGTDQLADGAGELAGGSRKLADGLARGAEQVPTYDQQTRTALAEVVATPVTAERPDSLFADIANTTFLAVLALWLGGLASFVILRAVPARVLTSMRPSWRLAADTVLPAAGIAVVQAVALTAALQVLLDLTARQVGAVAPLMILAGVAFVAVNHALVAWLGGVGRFISVAVVVSGAAAAITDAVPWLLDRLVAFLPITPALEGVRAVVSGGTGAWAAAGLLAAWLAAGLAAGVLAVARHRMAPAPVLAAVH